MVEQPSFAQPEDMITQALLEEALWAWMCRRRVADQLASLALWRLCIARLRIAADDSTDERASGAAQGVAVKDVGAAGQGAAGRLAPMLMSHLCGVRPGWSSAWCPGFDAL